MAPLEADTENLGQKHRDYNSKLQELITTDKNPENELEEGDINTLLKIDVASHNKDVDYILNVFMGDDMLYISRALTRSTWLVTDPKYADIINPDYLQSNIYPNMITKAIYKLKKHIQLNIKDESRAEMFYRDEKDKKDAIKWLPYCSVPFIESNLENHISSDERQPIKMRMFKRLCEKSTSVFDIVTKNVKYDKRQYLQAVTFFLNTDVDKYLDIMESNEYNYGYPKLNHNATDLIMKHSPIRVKENLEKYIASIHIPTFVKYFKTEEIKPFLIEQAKKDITKRQFTNLRALFHCNNLKYFINRLPKDEQFDFVKSICRKNIPTDAVIYELNRACCTTNRESYVWFQFAPFEVAFEEITKLIMVCDNSRVKGLRFALLIKCAENLEHIQTILKYYINKHKQEESRYKCEFVIELLNNMHISKYDEKTWNILNDLLKSMKIYEPCSDCVGNESVIISSILIYYALNNEKLPDNIEKLFTFNTLKSHKTKMNPEQHKKVFAFLYDYTQSKLKNSVANEKELKESIDALENMLQLIRDWDKSLEDFPEIINKIRELIKVKNENSWKVNMSSLYNVNKSWRKYLFEESIILSPNEEVCINALKHEPQLLARHTAEVNALRANDTLSLKRMLSKLRTYWSQSLAQEWKETYLKNINGTESHKASIKALCVILPQKRLIDIIEQYTPNEPKIDWNHIDERVLDIQRGLARYMHQARPQPIPDAIISYAKGDYLQFALPSLLAILYNLKSTQSKKYVPILLDAPVSVQKHGIRHAFKTLERDELKQIFLKTWKSSNNTTIRTIIFKYTFTLLCSEKDPENVNSLWELLEMFMDNLTLTEDKSTYQLLSKVEEVPLNVRAKFLVKSYNFLQKLIPTINESDRATYKWNCVTLARLTRDVMDTVCPEFVLGLISKFIEHDFLKCEDTFMEGIHNSNGLIRLISAYLLHAKDEDDQIRKYEEVLVPLLRRSFELWSEKKDGSFYIRRNVNELLTRLAYDLKDYVIEKKLLTPIRMFSLIQTELEKSLSVPENYVLLTNWRLAVGFTKLAQEYAAKGSAWDEKYILEYGKICLEYLKKDVLLHFACIYVLFSKAVARIINYMWSDDVVLPFYEGLLSDKDFIQAYLSSIEIGKSSRKNDKYKDIWNEVGMHPSVEVKMHYYTIIEQKEP